MLGGTRAATVVYVVLQAPTTTLREPLADLMVHIEEEAL